MRPLLLAALLAASPALAHDIYSGVYGKDGQLCCGGDGANPDCRPTIYRERGAAYEFLTPDGDWLPLPADVVTFLPVPGDKDDGDTHRAHLCVRMEPNVVTNYKLANREGRIKATIRGHEVVFYCAFIPPTGY